MDAVLKSLGHRRRDLTRQPKAAIRAAAHQLLRVAGSEAPRHGSAEYRVDGLAREAGVTTRNIRAYQERGLLHPPRRSGRLALYDDSHLARLRIIGSMLERGYTTAHITEMLTAWEDGKDLADVLGLERALITPWAEDRPTTTTHAKVRELAGSDADLRALVDAGLVRKSSNRTIVERPKLLEAFAEMRSYGMPTHTVIDLYTELQPAIEQISQLLVRAGATHFAGHFDPTADTSNADLAELIPKLIRFRSLALTSMTASLNTALETAVEEVLGDYLVQLTDAEPAASPSVAG